MLSSESTEEIEKQAGMISRKCILWLICSIVPFGKGGGSQYGLTSPG